LDNKDTKERISITFRWLKPLTENELAIELAKEKDKREERLKWIRQSQPAAIKDETPHEMFLRDLAGPRGARRQQEQDDLKEMQFHYDLYADQKSHPDEY
jgi:hypothetical protein